MAGKTITEHRGSAPKDMTIPLGKTLSNAADRRVADVIRRISDISDDVLAQLLRAAHVELDRRDPVGAEAARRARTNGDNDGGAA